MKSGAGEDPFAEDEPDDGVDDRENEMDVEEPVDDPAMATGEPIPSGTSVTDSTSTTEAEQATGKQSTAEIPWVLRRQKVKQDRTNVHQFFLRDRYSEIEDDLRSTVAGKLDMRTKDVKKLDLREAMVAVAANHPDEIAATLDEWGYEHLD